MELLRKSKKLFFGSLAGSFVGFFVPFTPWGFGGRTYTLEELAYQYPEHEKTKQEKNWSFEWVHPTGFVLRRSFHNEERPAVRRAVYRTIVNE